MKPLQQRGVFEQYSEVKIPGFGDCMFDFVRMALSCVRNIEKSVLELRREFAVKIAKHILGRSRLTKETTGVDLQLREYIDDPSQLERILQLEQWRDIPAIDLLLHYISDEYNISFVLFNDNNNCTSIFSENAPIWAGIFTQTRVGAHYTGYVPANYHRACQTMMQISQSNAKRKIRRQSNATTDSKQNEWSAPTSNEWSAALQTKMYVSFHFEQFNMLLFFHVSATRSKSPFVRSLFRNTKLYTNKRNAVSTWQKRLRMQLQKRSVLRR